MVQTFSAPRRVISTANCSCTNSTGRHYKNTVRKLALDIKEVRRRAQADVEDTRKYGVASLAKDILNVADDLERTVWGIICAQQTLYMMR